MLLSPRSYFEVGLHSPETVYFESIRLHYRPVMSSLVTYDHSVFGQLFFAYMQRYNPRVYCLPFLVRWSFEAMI